MDPTIPAAAKVTIAKNGPYRVSGNLPLGDEIIGANAAGESVKWEHGKDYSQQAQYALCRCGHSSHKPFCDGTHSKIGFDGTEPASRAPYSEQAKVLRGPKMSLTSLRLLCTNSGSSKTAGPQTRIRVIVAIARR